MRCAGPRASDCTRAPAGFPPGVPAQIGHVPFNPLTSQHFTFHAGATGQFEINNRVPHPPQIFFVSFFFCCRQSSRRSVFALSTGLSSWGVPFVKLWRNFYP